MSRVLSILVLFGGLQAFAQSQDPNELTANKPRSTESSINSPAHQFCNDCPQYGYSEVETLAPKELVDPEILDQAKKELEKNQGK